MCKKCNQPFQTQIFAECVGEFLGTLIIVLIGFGGSPRPGPHGFDQPRLGSWAAVNWGVAWILGVLVCDGASGAHISPAVTLSLWRYAQFPGWKVLPYMSSQFMACICGCALAFVLRHFELDVDDRLDAYIFSTKTRNDLKNGTAFLALLVASSFFLTLYFAVTDREHGPSPFRKGIALGLSIYVIQMSLASGFITGLTINPFQDLASRIFCSIAGWNNLFIEDSYFFWIPFITPFLASFVAPPFYIYLIENLKPDSIPGAAAVDTYSYVEEPFLTPISRNSAAERAGIQNQAD